MRLDSYTCFLQLQVYANIRLKLHTSPLFAASILSYISTTIEASITTTRACTLGMLIDTPSVSLHTYCILPVPVPIHYLLTMRLFGLSGTPSITALAMHRTCSYDSVDMCGSNPMFICTCHQLWQRLQVNYMMLPSTIALDGVVLHILLLYDKIICERPIVHVFVRVCVPARTCIPRWGSPVLYSK
jgi:hypothetical protein